MKGDHGDFGAAVEACSNTRGADAPTRILNQIANLVLTHGIFMAHGWGDEFHEGQADLAAVGMS